jgi:hypothetical protein
MDFFLISTGLVFYYKIASLYFGSGDNEKAIDYLNKIINEKADLRTDLQCYSRLLHLIAHYELGNFELLNTSSNLFTATWRKCKTSARWRKKYLHSFVVFPRWCPCIETGV